MAKVRTSKMILFHFISFTCWMNIILLLFELRVLVHHSRFSVSVSVCLTLFRFSFIQFNLRIPQIYICSLWLLSLFCNWLLRTHLSYNLHFSHTIFLYLSRPKCVNIYIIIYNTICVCVYGRLCTHNTWNIKRVYHPARFTRNCQRLFVNEIKINTLPNSIRIGAEPVMICFALLLARFLFLFLLLGR